MQSRLKHKLEQEAGQHIDMSPLLDVRSSVEQMLKQQQRPVVIQADKTVPTELLVQVIDEAKLAGAAQVNLATKQ